MKVLQVLNHFLPSQTAGTEIYVWSLARKLQEYGVVSKIAIPNYNQKFSADYMYDGLQVHQFAEPSIVDRSLIMGFRKPEGLVSFKEYIDSEKPDIIHFHDIAGSNGVSIHHISVAKATGAKVLLTFHLAGLSCMTGTLMKKDNSLCDGKIELNKCATCYLHSKKVNNYSAHLLTWISRFFNYLSINPTKLSTTIGTALGTVSLVKQKQEDLYELIENCDKVVVLSDWYKDILISNGIQQNKIISIPQGLASISSVSNMGKKTSNKLNFIFVGRISPFKGLHLLVDAFMQLDKGKAELHIYGQSDGTEYEKTLKEKSKYVDSIQWKGLLPQNEVVRTMSQYDALCLCSTFSEMSPLVIQEAFAANIPVIASNVYGNAEQIKHGVNGLLFKFNDSDDLLKQLERCINEPNLLAGLASNILSPNSFDAVSKQHLVVYNQLLYSN